MRLGFTGTRQGMTAAQQQTFNEWLCCELDITEFHHGDCIGADDDAANELHGIMTGEDPGPPIKVVVHPPIDQTHQANNPHYDEIRSPNTYFARNRDIVDESDLLVACPVSMTEASHGGTWYTVNYARKRGKPVLIIWPNGTITEEAGKQ